MSADKSCYSTLSNYNAYGAGLVNGPETKQPVHSQAVTMVPVWGGKGYDALSHGNSCSGYPTIEAAYPDYNKACGTMMKRACAGTKLSR